MKKRANITTQMKNFKQKINLRYYAMICVMFEMVHNWHSCTFVAEQLTTDSTTSIYSFDISNVHDFDILNMKAPSALEVNNEQVSRANAPPPKRKKMNSDTSGISIEEWRATGISTPGKNKSGLNNNNPNIHAHMNTLQQQAIMNNVTASANYQRKTSWNHSFPRTPGSVSSGEAPLASLSTRLPYLREVFLKDKPPSNLLLSETSNSFKSEVGTTITDLFCCFLTFWKS